MSGHVEGQDCGVVVHAGAEGVEEVPDRGNGVAGGGRCQLLGELQQGLVAVAALGADGVGFGEPVRVQEQGVTGVEADAGGGDVGVGQDADELAAGVGRKSAWPSERISRAGGWPPLARVTWKPPWSPSGVSRPKMTVQNRGSWPLYS